LGKRDHSMPKIRVLVVDDAVVIRKILTDVLSSDPQIEVVGTAANGKIALQKIPQVNPDIITLDIEMPELSGLDTIPLIRKDYPKIPIIMFSTLTERGAKSTMEALSRGASDYVTKPANVGNVTNAKEAVKEVLISKIKNLVPSSGLLKFTPQAVTISSLPKQNAVSLAQPKHSMTPIEIVVIGVSTGGPNALAEVIPALPKDFPVPIMIVQHMPPMFTRLLAERLDGQSELHIIEASSNMKITKGEIYIAPGDFHLEAKRSGTNIVTVLQQEPQENSCRPAVDVLFRSIVPIYGGGVLAVILTGMGQDGLRGCQHIKEAGGSVIVQDESTSVVWGMPGFVAQAGIADAIVPLNQIASEIVKRVTNSQTLNSILDRKLLNA
jgi:two-component system chemotaxis response regulator CheB